jgi:hypothetical protein
MSRPRLRAQGSRDRSPRSRCPVFGDEEMAELERRNAEVERLAADLERDRAAVLERREPG